MRKLLWTYFIFLGSLLSSCSIVSLREAREVVAQADSLWHEGKMYGVDAGDSASLAQAYETLGHFPLSWHPLLWRGRGERLGEVSYHYGKLLRAKDDPVAAMQAFIAATHSRTKDYHILGRVYSNIGDLCHLAGDFPLSYDMFSRSANCFLRNRDTLLYYYSLNNMAFELAEQGKKDSCFSIIQDIEIHNAQNKSLLTYCCISKTEALLKTSQYDSAIECALLSKRYMENIPTVDLQLAQAYFSTGKKDSSVYYANKVVKESNELFEINNALYILTNNDKTKDIESIRQTAADRADTQKLLEIRQGQMSQAVQLLQQDLTRKPDRGWLYAVIVTILIIGCLLSIYVYRQHKRRQLLSQQIDDYQQKRLADLEISCTALRNNKNLKKELDWNHYESMCMIVNSRLCGIADRLQAYPDITPNDIRLCVLVLLELSYDEIANILNLSPKSIAKLKSITAHKLGTTMKNLRTTLVQIACQNNT